MILPSARLGSRHLFCESNAALLVELDLPGGCILMRVKPVRYEVLGDSGGCGGNFRIGARIDEITEGDRTLLVEYLRQAKGAPVKNAARPGPQGHASAVGL